LSQPFSRRTHARKTEHADESGSRESHNHRRNRRRLEIWTSRRPLVHRDVNLRGYHLAVQPRMAVVLRERDGKVVAIPPANDPDDCGQSAANRNPSGDCPAGATAGSLRAGTIGIGRAFSRRTRPASYRVPSQSWPVTTSHRPTRYLQPRSSGPSQIAGFFMKKLQYFKYLIQTDKLSACPLKKAFA